MLQSPKIVAQLPSTRVEYLLVGDGAPPIVLMNGGGGPIEGWYKVLPRLSEASTTLAYNRAGIGRSSKPSAPQTSDVVVQQLRHLLEHLLLPPPYLLVGHSLGGLHANYFARAYPDEVCGLVLLDATAPDDVDLMASSRSPVQKTLQKLADRIFDPGSIGEAGNASASASMIQSAGPFPAIPLAAISGGAPIKSMSREARHGRMVNQQQLSRLSPKGRHLVAEHSGHFPQITQPELVGEVILQIWTEAGWLTSRLA